MFNSGFLKCMIKLKPNKTNPRCLTWMYIDVTSILEKEGIVDGLRVVINNSATVFSFAVHSPILVIVDFIISFHFPVSA